MLAEVEPLPPEDEGLARGLVAELGRRRVLQVALIYAAIAWTITEALSFLLDALPVLPEWSKALVAIIFLAGFPVAMFLAWRFDIGPSGIRRTQAVRTKDRLTIPAAMLLLISATAGLFYLIYPRVLEQADLTSAQEQAAFRGVSSPNAIAVLPFVDMSPNQDQEYFADGIAEELLNELSQLEGLHVAGRTSSFTFKGSNEDLQSIGEQLGVTSILEGSVRKDGNGVRITVQLINSLTGFHLWSKTYDRQIDDIFFIQEDIARSVAGALSIALGVDGRNELPGTGTSNIEAYDAFLEGRALGRVGQSEQALAHFGRAIDIDPSYAAAWLAFGAATGIMSWDQPPEQARATQERGRELVLRAIELDPNLAGAHSILGQFNWARGDWVGAAEAHEKAIALAPADIGPQMGYANVLGRVGRVRAAIEIAELGREIDPVDFYGAMIMAEQYIQVGRYSDARADLEKAETLSPTRRPGVVMRRLFIAMSQSEPARIRESLEKLADVNPAVATIANSVLAEFDSPPSDVLRVLRRTYDDAFETSPEGRVVTASLAAYFGDPELALEIMTEELRGNLLRTGRLWYPFFSDMRKLPGFKALVDEIGFVAYWRAYGWADSCRPLSNDDFECY
jgi:TolB-like protein/cytochrome c-type biogenesis protein CcmH/NrfG